MSQTDKSIDNSGADDFDALIDKAVDTFFVEGPTEEEMAAAEIDLDGGEQAVSAPEPSEPAPPPPPPAPEPDEDAPSLDDAVESLFGGGYEEEAPLEGQSTASTGQAPFAESGPPDEGFSFEESTDTDSEQEGDSESWITSGDPDTDKAIDLAVETLFVEAPGDDDTPPPETAKVEAVAVDTPERDAAEEAGVAPAEAEPELELEVEVEVDDGQEPVDEVEVEIIEGEDVEEFAQADIETEEAPAGPPEPAPPDMASAEPPAFESDDLPSFEAEEVPSFEAEEAPSLEDEGLPSFEEPPAAAGRARAGAPPSEPPFEEPDQSGPQPVTQGDSYDDNLAQEIQRHVETEFELELQVPQQVTATAPAEAERPPRPPTTGITTRPDSPLRKLQEAILTLEWEISRRSVKALSHELQAVRTKFRDDMTVDFAALSMKIVLDYLVKRMHKAHPESIRFLLEVTDYLERATVSTKADPLIAFHNILTRYERYKTVVRKAEGLPNREPAISANLEITDPQVFYDTVTSQAKTLVRAGRSLARQIENADDPQTLIRSFRFLVNRSVSRILDNTQKADSGQKARKSRKKKSSGGSKAQ